MKIHGISMFFVMAAVAAQGANAGALVDVSRDSSLGLNANISQKAMSPEAAARQFLAAKAAELGLQADLSDLALDSITQSPIGSHVRFAQLKNGLVVDQAEIVVTLSKENRVLTYINDYKRSESTQLSGASKTGITEAQAIEIAYNHLKLSASPTLQTIVKKVSVENGMATVVYQVNLSAPVDRVWSWEMTIDANSGKVFRSETKAFDARDSDPGKKTVASVSANVFEPNPTIKSGSAYGQVSGYDDANHGDSSFFDSMMTAVVLDNVTQTGSKYSLVGPNVQIADTEAPTNPKCDTTAAKMSYTRNNPCFDDVSVYYFIDQSLKYLNGPLGFNAHPIKYKGGIKADPHGVNGDDNSHYDTQNDFLAFGEGGVPDAQDHDVVIHEFGHAIHNWLTNGHLSQVDGLSEGIADYWASSYDRQFMKPDHVAYNWTFSYDGHNDFWPGRVNNITLKYPDAVQGDNSEIHTAGQLWATACMDIYNSLGKLKTDKIHWTGIAMLNSSSGQLDAAKAFVVATRQLYPNEADTIATVIQKFQSHGLQVQ